MLGSHQQSVSTHEAGLTLRSRPLVHQMLWYFGANDVCARVDQLPTNADFGILK